MSGRLRYHGNSKTADPETMQDDGRVVEVSQNMDSKGIHQTMAH
jgi:hypothetical protein